jgi:hypothetical protein
MLHPESITQPESLKAQPSGMAHNPKSTPSGMTTHVSTKSFSHTALTLVCDCAFDQKIRHNKKRKITDIFMVLFM